MMAGLFLSGSVSIPGANATPAASPNAEAQFEPVPMPASSTTPQTELTDLEQEITRLYNEGQYTSATPLARKAVELAEKLGADHVEEIVAALLNLSSVLQASGEPAEAREALQRALILQEKAAGSEHPDLAVVLNKLAALLRTQGDYDSAEPLLRKAVKINEKAFGEDSLDLARDVKGLASVMEAKGDPKTALSLYERAERIVRNVLNKLTGDAPPAAGSDSDNLARKVKLELELADVLNDQSAILQGVNEIPRAQETLEQALEIRKRLLGSDDIEVAELLNNQASLLFKLGRLDEAKAMLEDVAKRYGNAVGSTRLDLVTIKNNLGELNQRLGDASAAQLQFQAAGTIFNEQSRQILPMLSLAEQRAFIDERVFPELSVLLDSCPTGDQVKNVYEIIYPWKGMLIDAMRKETQLNSLSGNQVFRDKIAKLKQIRSQMAAWFYSAIANDPNEWAKKNRELTEEKEQIERQLSRAQAADKFATSADLKESLALLGENETLVDVYSYNSCKKSASGPRYAAVIIGKSCSPTLVDLGAATEINAAVNQWNEDVVHLLEAKASWSALSSLIWTPILSALPKNTKKLWVCPDDELYRIPWHLFSCAEDKTEGLDIAEADSVREIFGLRRSQKDVATNGANVLLVGGVDFDSDGTGKKVETAALIDTTATKRAVVTTPAPKSGKAAPEQPSGLHMAFLPGTLGEIAAIETLAKSSGLPVAKITGASATEEAVVEQLASSAYVHLATHGIFLNDVAINRVFGKTNTRSVEIRASRQWSDYSMKRNPLVTSVIALAGANNESSAGGLNGILSAEEVVGLNLRQCKLITLSACETGIGRHVTGQGVMGLRASFIAAGAQSLLISLWKVPDEPTVQLMRDFYENLWVKKMTKLHALKQAQLDAQKKIYGRRPVNWAAWVLVGE